MQNPPPPPYQPPYGYQEDQKHMNGHSQPYSGEAQYLMQVHAPTGDSADTDPLNRPILIIQEDILENGVSNKIVLVKEEVPPTSGKYEITDIFINKLMIF